MNLNDIGVFEWPNTSSYNDRSKKFVSHTTYFFYKRKVYRKRIIKSLTLQKRSRLFPIAQAMQPFISSSRFTQNQHTTVSFPTHILFFIFFAQANYRSSYFYARFTLRRHRYLNASLTSNNRVGIGCRDLAGVSHDEIKQIYRQTHTLNNF